MDLVRWIQAATDADEVLIRHCPVAERPTDADEVRVIAPFLYRRALWEAVGQRAGDYHFYDVLKVQGGTAVPALWADAWRLRGAPVNGGRWES